VAESPGARKCRYCGQADVHVERDSVQSTAWCGSCQREWSYPNPMLSEEIVLDNFDAHAERRK